MWRSLVTRSHSLRPAPCRLGAGALQSVAMHGEALRVEAEPAVQAPVVEQQHAGLRLAAHLDLDLELVAEIAGDESTAARRRAAACPCPPCTSAPRSRSAGAATSSGARIVEGPLRAQLVAREIVRERHAVRQRATPPRGLRNGATDRRRRPRASRRRSSASDRAASGGRASRSRSRSRDTPSTRIRRAPRSASRGRATTISPRPITVRTIGLFGAFSQGPWIERERATITMWPVGGPAVPPTARIR